MGFYDIKTVILPFVCFYESLKTLKLNKLFFNHPPPLHNSFFGTKKKQFHLIFEEHTAKKQRGPPVGSLADPCHRAQLAPTQCTAVSPGSADTSPTESQHTEEFQIHPFHGGSGVFAQIWAGMQR